MTPEDRIIKKNIELGNTQSAQANMLSTYGFLNTGHFFHAKKLYWEMFNKCKKSPLQFHPKIQNKIKRELFYKFASYLNDKV